MIDVFLSYDHRDSDFATVVQIKLEKAGLSVWKDSGQINAGDKWRDEIDQGILDSSVLVVVMSQEAFSSQYVTYEWAFSLGSGKKVIPILLRKTDFHPRLESFHYLDFTSHTVRPWSRLIEIVSQNKSSSPKTTTPSLPRGTSGKDSDTPPLVSVCTITRRSKPRIKRLVELLKEQSYSDFEFLIIDGYYYARKEMMERLLKELNPQFRLRYLPPKPSKWRGIRPDLSNARNTSLIWAQGKIIVEIDDCCLDLCPGFIERHVNWIGEGFAVSGSCEIGGWCDDRKDKFKDPQEITARYFYGGNRSFLLETALNVNGYEEFLDGEQGQEDVLLSHMLELAGVRFMYDPNLRVTFDDSAHTLTQLSPDPRKATWDKEPWAVEAKKQTMPDGTERFTNDWYARQCINDKLAKPKGNNFELKDIKRIPRAVNFDIPRFQTCLRKYVDTDPADWRDGESISSMRGDFFIPESEENLIANRPIGHGCISNDLSFLIAASGDSLIRYDLNADKVESVRIDTEPSSILVSPVTRTLIVPTTNRTIRIYNPTLSTFAEFRHHREVISAICVSRTEKYCASADWNKQLHIWNFKTQKLIISLNDQAHVVTCLAMTDDEQCLIAGSSDGHSYIWREDKESKPTKVKLWQCPVASICPFTINGKLNVLIGSVDGSLKIWNPESSRLSTIPSEHSKEITHIQTTLNFAYGITASSEGLVSIWDLRNRRLLQSLSLHHQIVDMRISVKHQKILVLTSDGVLRTWQVSCGFMLTEGARLI